MMSPQQRSLDTDTAVEPLDAERSLGELFSKLGEDLSGLVTSQIELARTELTAEAKDAGKAAGLLAAGSITAYLALTLLCFAAAWGLSEVVPEGVAFLIVGLIVGLVAGALVLVGRKHMEAAKRVAPETIETIKEDVQWTRRQMT
jgi:F0F1-type ATP synthase assembly protein I